MLVVVREAVELLAVDAARVFLPPQLLLPLTTTVLFFAT